MILEDFYKETLQKLGTLAAEEPMAPSDRLKVVDKYEQVHSEYAERNLTTWFDDDDIPEEVADGFAAMVANRLTSVFSVSQEKLVELKLEAADGETRLIARGQRRELPQQKTVYY